MEVLQMLKQMTLLVKWGVEGEIKNLSVSKEMVGTERKFKYGLTQKRKWVSREIREQESFTVSRTNRTIIVKS